MQVKITRQGEKGIICALLLGIVTIILGSYACALEFSPSSINEVLSINKFVQKNITLKNELSYPVRIALVPSSNISDLLDITPNSIEIGARESKNVLVTIYGNVDPIKFINRSYYIFNGFIKLEGANAQIPTDLMVTNGTINLPSSMVLSASAGKDYFTKSENLSFIIVVTNLMTGSKPNVTLFYYFLIDKNSEIPVGNDSFIITTSKSVVKEFIPMSSIPDGTYTFRVVMSYADKKSVADVPFRISTPFIFRTFLGIAVWQYILGVIALIIIGLLVYWRRKRVLASRRYGVSVDLRSFPSSGRLVRLGKLAEYGRDFWFDL
ncbi:MAG: hypothetical protein QXJ50_02250, partial [Candidatus Woesearchaeota archaeon]